MLCQNYIAKEIYLQTRIEFWVKGKLLRMKKQQLLEVLIIYFFAGDSFQYNDAKLTFEIPQNEVLNNVYH
jgi:hypothetical protein